MFYRDGSTKSQSDPGAFLGQPLLALQLLVCGTVCLLNTGQTRETPHLNLNFSYLLD